MFSSCLPESKCCSRWSILYVCCAHCYWATWCFVAALHWGSLWQDRSLPFWTNLDVPQCHAGARPFQLLSCPLAALWGHSTRVPWGQHSKACLSQVLGPVAPTWPRPMPLCFILCRHVRVCFHIVGCLVGPHVLVTPSTTKKDFMTLQLQFCFCQLLVFLAYFCLESNC